MAKDKAGSGRRSRSPAPTIGYDRWQYQVGDEARALYKRSGHSVSIDYARAHDAWRAGKTPAQYVAQLAQGQPRRATTAPAAAPRDHRELVDIRWSATPNENARAGGFLPRIRIGEGRLRGDSWAARGYDIEEARRLAKEEAQEEAGRYRGDYRAVVSEDSGEGDNARLDREISSMVGRRI